MSPFIEIYFRNPMYFQRMLEFVLHQKFRTVRIHMRDMKDTECMFFTVDGRIMDVSDDKRRFDTITDWYNAVHNTTFPIIYPGIFEEIYITQRNSLSSVIESVTQKDIQSFRDLRYKSSVAYNRIVRILRTKYIRFMWDKKTPLALEWNGVNISLGRLHASAEHGNMNAMDNLLDILGNEEKTIPGLVFIRDTGERVQLFDDVVEGEEGGEKQRRAAEEDTEDVENVVNIVSMEITALKEEITTHKTAAEQFKRELQETNDRLAKLQAIVEEDKKTILALVDANHKMTAAVNDLIAKQAAQQPPTMYPMYYVPQQ